MLKNRKDIFSLPSAINTAIVFLIVIMVCTSLLSCKSGEENMPEEASGDVTENFPATETKSDKTGEDNDSDNSFVSVTQTDTGSSDSTQSTTANDSSEPIHTDDQVVFFDDTYEQVTAKIEVNLRSSMEQGTDSNIVCRLVNGDIAVRTGIGRNGWSRIEYNSQILYCISSYLTTDLEYVPHTDDSSEFNTKFTPVYELVTAKDVTNLRDRPSVFEPSQVIFQLHNGEKAVRVGIAGEGWSKVEYNGRTLYCISSYLELFEEQRAATLSFQWNHMLLLKHIVKHRISWYNIRRNSCNASL